MKMTMRCLSVAAGLFLASAAMAQREIVVEDQTQEAIQVVDGCARRR